MCALVEQETFGKANGIKFMDTENHGNNIKNIWPKCIIGIKSRITFEGHMGTVGNNIIRNI
jgi:hypothetical protein